jgi:hypothetical protein
MAKTKISEFDTDPDLNTDVNSINIAEGCSPANINNAIRQLMSDLKEWQNGSQDRYIAPAGTAAAPSWTFNGDLDTGFYSGGANVVGVAANGVSVGTFTSAGFVGNVTGNLTGNVTGNVTGNASTVTNGVYTVGDQTIAGVKTFSSSPIVPTPTLGDNSFKAASTAFVGAQITDYAPSKIGTNASGTWGISITGNAAGLSSALAIASGGTAATTAANARTNLGVPANDGTGASGTWGIAITGNAATATTATTVSDGAITPAKLNGAQSGSAPIYGARAWVNFNGTGTPAIRSSGNVSSITDNGTGDYTINFTTAMQDTNYSAVATAKTEDNNVIGVNNNTTTAGTAIRNTGNVTVLTSSTSSIKVDCAVVNVAIFR